MTCPGVSTSGAVHGAKPREAEEPVVEGKAIAWTQK